MGFEDWHAIERHHVIGALWETHVVMETFKTFASGGRNVPMWFWRTAGGDEVDLIIEQDGRVTAIECKYTEAVDKSSLKGLRIFIGDYGPENVKGRYIACRSPISYPLNGDITAIPGSRISEYVR
jgi:predicted AAA+ superfamily ATPase